MVPSPESFSLMRGMQSLGTPRVYVKLLVELEDFLNKTLAGARPAWRISQC